MNTKPRAKKFRVRRSAILAQDGNDARRATAEAAAENLARKGDAPATQSIPVENLTERQLRLAGRLAERRGLNVKSDTEAIQALRARGIDPFTQARIDLVEKNIPRPQPVVPTPTEAPVHGGPQLPAQAAPAPVPAAPAPASLPSVDTLKAAESNRAAEIMKMQREVAQRRRRRIGALIGRLFALVLVPTLASWYYFSNVASPLYSTHSDFLIRQSEGQAGGGASGLLSGTPLASSEDSVAVQRILTSRGAMLRLEEEVGFREFFSGDDIDALQRLPADASNEVVYRRYTKTVKIGYDPSEGLIRMEVLAPDPQVGVDISQALLRYAEEEVDALNKPIRRDQMAGAQESLVEAEANLMDAQRRVLELQEARGVLSAEAEISTLMSQISTFEVALHEERLSLQAQLDNSRPNATKVSVSEREIARLETLIASLRSELTEDRAGGVSLAKITGELVLAEAELQTRQLMVSQALQSLETARIEANRQVRYLLQGVRPTLTDEPSYPKVFENTLLAFVIFSGIYLMASLTISVLREQVSS